MSESLRPTKADLEAADDFASHTDPVSAGPMHIGFVSGILHERERAAGVAQGYGEISSNPTENRYGKFIAAAIREGPP